MARPHGPDPAACAVTAPALSWAGKHGVPLASPGQLFTVASTGPAWTAASVCPAICGL